jgi:carbonic anhydrase/acetyltransferase-like protein (isoleucine patch superfamily)
MLTEGMSKTNGQSVYDRHLRKQPVLGRAVYVARGAVVVGDVTIGARSSIWYNTVLRGDVNRIVVGQCTNIQDNTVVHLTHRLPCLIGSHVTIGHCAVVHACVVGDGCLIGMGSVLMEGAEIGGQSLVAAHSLVTQGMKVPPGSLVMGSPARVVRKLTAQERRELKMPARHYVQNAAYCLKHGINVTQPPDIQKSAPRNCGSPRVRRCG